jgi:8-oxo-dGTP pyrophosphatase MutT (NUDIX family)
LQISLIKSLKSKLTQDLPGWDAQKLMSPIKTAKYRETASDAKKAGVMLLLHPNENNDLSLFYIKRTSHNPNDKHGGQISFPGGQVEQMDNDYSETAIRETYEEIGVNSGDIQVLGHLTSIYVFASNFYVQPVVGFLPYNPTLVLQESEVDYTIQTSLETLTDPNIIQTKDFKFGSFDVKNMPYYNIHNEVLWGATAMITSEFLTVLDTVS